LDILRLISDFNFLNIFLKNLLYAYTENTLNGEIGTKSVDISANNDTNKKNQILSIYTKWLEFSVVEPLIFFTVPFPTFEKLRTGHCFKLRSLKKLREVTG
jgi:hypothetical protein